MSSLQFLNHSFTFLLGGLTILILFIWYLVSDLDVIKRKAGSLLIAIVVVLCAAGFLNNGIKKGIDLQGGTSLTLEVKPKEEGEEVTISKDALEQARAIVEKRLNNMGTSDVNIIAQPPNRLLVQAPGISPENRDYIKTEVTRIAKLEILEVHPENDRFVAEGRKNVPGYREYNMTFEDREGNEVNTKIWLTKRGKLSGKQVQRASVDQTAKGQVLVDLNSEGADIMRDITSKMQIGRDRLAVVLDDRVVVAPTVNATLGSNFVISGLTKVDEAKKVADALNNPLDNPLDIIEMRDVSASLGQETIRQGLIAGAIGLSLTALVMLICYRFAGFVALIALAVNIVILLGSMSIFGFVITLPGIAGIILTIGMAVDANVLIYERLREEMAEGKSVGNALRLAYEKAFSSIFDANITTLITAFILFWRASGTVKGFAITLTLGIISSMFAALIVTRVAFYYLNGAKSEDKIKKLHFPQILPQTHLNFLKLRKFTLTGSILAIVAAIGITLYKGDETLGVDFTGGSLITYDLKDESVTEPKIKALVEAQKLSKSPFIQAETDGTGIQHVTVRLADNEQDINLVKSVIAKEFPVLTEPLVENVGSALGKEFLITSAIALGIGLFGIMVYVTLRFEFSFAFAAICALVHDLLIVMGIVAFSDAQFNLIHIGAFLTLAGYSINDTIIVFDRIREQLREGTGTVVSVMNEAINSTLSRTTLTSLTTLVSILALYFFGGAAMKDFSFTIVVGLIVGTYSSIFVASPLVLVLNRKKDLRDEILAAERAKSDATELEVIEP